MFNHAEAERYERIKINAAFFGVKIDDKKNKTSPSIKEKDTFMFGDPEEYKNMTAEDKKKLTKDMMGRHKEWARKAPVKGE